MNADDLSIAFGPSDLQYERRAGISKELGISTRWGGDVVVDHCYFFASLPIENRLTAARCLVKIATREGGKRLIR